MIDLFINLIQQFVNGNISAPEFEIQYLDLWRNARDSKKIHLVNDEGSNPLDTLFTAVDAYCSDKDLRDDKDLDDGQLLNEAKKALKTLEGQ